MTPARSQELVVGCLAASAAVAAGSVLAQHREPGIKLVVGVAATGVGLATLSMFAPDLAGAFATLVLTTTVFVYGGPVMDLVAIYTGNGPTSLGHPSKTPAPPADKTGSVKA